MAWERFARKGNFAEAAAFAESESTLGDALLTVADVVDVADGGCGLPVAPEA